MTQPSSTQGASQFGHSFTISWHIRSSQVDCLVPISDNKQLHFKHHHIDIGAVCVLMMCYYHI